MEVGTNFKLVLRDGLSISKTESGHKYVNARTKLTCHVVFDVSTKKMEKDFASSKRIRLLNKAILSFYQIKSSYLILATLKSIKLVEMLIRRKDFY